MTAMSTVEQVTIHSISRRRCSGGDDTRYHTAQYAHVATPPGDRSLPLFSDRHNCTSRVTLSFT
ncbi:hypothetical protein GDO81_001130 [Engystomops pustulosus]|uniref:Uncharacterized protein n=1 Tax=Engystomops pustulosus TaxID=76066 RepID=A0AAV7D9W2_ENGPU|nr:hypothetical protein GDO81_001130 [Engystomops pustulosus]